MQGIVWQAKVLSEREKGERETIYIYIVDWWSDDQLDALLKKKHPRIAEGQKHQCHHESVMVGFWYGEVAYNLTFIYFLQVCASLRNLMYYNILGWKHWNKYVQVELWSFKSTKKLFSLKMKHITLIVR